MSDQPDKQDSGLYIDSDWKRQAAEEKKRLAEGESKSKEHEAGQTGSATPQEMAFLELVNMMAMQAAIGLGGFQGPGGERIPPNFDAAKHHIDLLAVLQDRTKGNLTDTEKKALDGVIYELRMQYTQIVTQSANTPPPTEQP